MHSLLTHKASEIGRQTREAIEAECGRALHDDEEVSLMAFLPHDAPDQMSPGLDSALARVADKLQNIPAGEFDEIFLEAMRSVRPGYTERPTERP